MLATSTTEFVESITPNSALYNDWVGKDEKRSNFIIVKIRNVCQDEDVKTT